MGATLSKTWQDVQRELYTPEEIALTNTRVAIGIALTRARRERGLTQKELSKLSGVNQSTISRLEQGIAPARLDTLIRLTRALDLQLALYPQEGSPLPRYSAL